MLISFDFQKVNCTFDCTLIRLAIKPDENCCYQTCQLRFFCFCLKIEFMLWWAFLKLENLWWHHDKHSQLNNLPIWVSKTFFVVSRNNIFLSPRKVNDNKPSELEIRDVSKVSVFVFISISRLENPLKFQSFNFFLAIHSIESKASGAE